MTQITPEGHVFVDCRCMPTEAEDERARIVAWLRKQAERQIDDILRRWLLSLADAIARGEHGG